MNKIKQLREKKELSQTQLANRVGITTGYLCHLENGTRDNPSYKIMKKIAKELQTSISDIFI